MVLLVDIWFCNHLGLERPFSGILWDANRANNCSIGTYCRVPMWDNHEFLLRPWWWTQKVTKIILMSLRLRGVEDWNSHSWAISLAATWWSFLVSVMRRFSSLCVFKCVLKLTALTDSVVYNWYGFGFHSYDTWFGEECVAGLTAAVNLGDPPQW